MTKVLTKKEYNELPEEEKRLYDALYTILQAKEGIENNICKLGYGLYQAKQLVAHGEWEDWLRDNVDFSVRTAQRYIKTYKEFSELQCTYEELDTLNDNKILALLDVKKDDREDFINNTHEVQGIEKTIKEMSVVELEDTIKEYKKAKKQPKKNIKSDKCDVFESDNKVIDVDFKESQETEQTLTEEQKLAQLIKEQQELEQQLKTKQRQARETKENILKNKKLLDLEVEFEEVLKDGIFYSKELHYNVYLIRGSSKQLVLEDVYANWIIDLIIDENKDVICSHLKVNKNLLQEEKDFIIGECLRFKEKAIRRDEEVKNMSGFEDEMYKKINEEISRRKQLPQENQDLKKEFIIAGYKALAKKYHPDCNQGNAEAEDNFKAIGILKDTLLQQNLLN